MSTTTPFRALEPVIRERPVAAPKVIDADAAHERKHAGVDRWKHLPAEGPREVHAEVIGGAIRLVPTDRVSARDLMSARSAIGRTYDRRREDYLFPFDDLARHGAVNMDSFRLACEVAGVNLVIGPEAYAAIERHGKALARQLRPIPRTVWVDEDASDHDEANDVTVVDFTHNRR